ncbi:MAG: phosphonate ABC transporter, permease protein PhnE [Phycisphaeraceae bacterium]|nr:phosphonate ABC transporter, permease protein PhnE [Phycisphaeraceae bacterium]
MTTLALGQFEAEQRPVGAIERADPSFGPVLLRAEGLGKVYPDGTCALAEVALSVRAGERVVILGASGSGKTTLLGCLTGRLTPTSGRVERDGGIAIIHQDLRLVRQRSALSNVLHGTLARCSLARSMLGFARSERQRARELLERVGLGDRMHSPVSRLSGGEQQRVAIARALMQNPRILLADEPVASLDEFNARQIMQLLDELCRERRLALVSVLHDCDLAESFSDRILGLDQGRIVFDSSLTPSQRFDCQACRLIREHAARSGPPESMALDRPAWFKPAVFAGVLLIGLAIYVWAFSGMEIDQRQLRGAGPGLGRFMADLLPMTSAQWERLAAVKWGELVGSLFQTIQMSIIGTTFGVLLAWPLAALAARNVGPRYLQSPMRLVLNTIRTVPSLIWALLFVAAVGPGVLAGVMALTAYSIGYLTKFFYEAFEAVEPGAPDALKELGANGPKRFLHAVWPSARPAVLSSGMFMLEYNVRAASVLGIVGAGGIGYYIALFVDWRNFPAVLVCLIMILIVVVALDALSTYIRGRLVRA